VNNFVFDQSKRTHMPFIFEGKKLLYCQVDNDRDIMSEGVGRRSENLPIVKYQNWRIMCCDYPSFQNGFELEPTMQVNSISCNPMAYRDIEGQIHLTYVSTTTHHNVRPVHRLWEKTGEEMESLGVRKMVENTLRLRPYSGFINENYKVIANMTAGHPFLIYEDYEQERIFKVKFSHMDHLKRICFVSDSPDLVILTYAKKINDNGVIYYGSTLWDIITNKFWEIIINDISLYKCTFFNEKIIYTWENLERCKEDCYDTHLKIAGHFSLKISSMMNVVEELTVKRSA